MEIRQSIARPSAPEIRKAVVRSLNIPSLAMGVSTVISGWVAARVHDNFDLMPALMCLLFVCFAQMSGNVIYRYFDLLHNRGEGTFEYGHTWRQTLLPVYKALVWGLSVLTCILGLGIMELSGWWSVLVGGIIVFLIWIDMAPPLALGRTPWGLVVTFLLFGPVGVIGTTLVQSQLGVQNPFNQFDLLPPLLLSINVGFLMVCCHLSFCYVGYRNDLRNSKYTFAVSFGRPAARRLYLSCVILSYAAFVGWCIFFDVANYQVEMILPTLCMVWLMRVWWSMGHGDHNIRLIVLGTLYGVLARNLLNFILFLILGPAV